MVFERVLMVWDLYDGPRTGLALYNGAAHYFRCEFDSKIGMRFEMKGVAVR